jgi:hypothetical protein
MAATKGRGGSGGERGPRLLALAVEAFDADNIGAVDADTLSEQLISMRNGIDRLEAQFSRRLVRFDVIRGYENAGAADLISWLRCACRMGTSAAARRLHLARQITELPETEAAWRSGAISTGHAAVIGRTVDEMGDEGARAAQPTLLEAANQMNPGHTSVISLGPTRQPVVIRMLPNSASSLGSASRAIRKVLVVLTAPPPWTPRGQLIVT